MAPNKRQSQIRRKNCPTRELSASQCFSLEKAPNRIMASKHSLSCIELLFFLFFTFIQFSSGTVCGSRFGAVIDGLESDFEVFSEHVGERFPLNIGEKGCVNPPPRSEAARTPEHATFSPNIKGITIRIRVSHMYTLNSMVQTLTHTCLALRGRLLAKVGSCRSKCRQGATRPCRIST